MSGITRCIFRWGLVGGLALGGLTLLVGPERVAAGISQIRAKAQTVVDSCVDDPVALRRQLAELAEEYPDRIAEVRAELAEVDHQIGEFDRKMEVADRVVAITTDHLMTLKQRVARAEKAAQDEPGRPVRVSFEGAHYDINEAYSVAQRINNVRQAYRERQSQDQMQLQVLREQKTRLTEILDELETEYNSFQAQMWQLDRQIDAIERNERLIELTEQQQARLDEYERMGEVGNIKQLEAKLAELRAYQQAQLDTLAKEGVRRDYERQAELQLSEEQLDRENPFDIENTDADDNDNDESDDDEKDRAIAWNGTLIIE